MKTHSKLDETKIIFSKSVMRDITEYNLIKDEKDEKFKKNEIYDKILNLIPTSLQLKLIRNFDNEKKFNEILETEFNDKFYLVDVFNIFNGMKTQEEINPKNVKLNITSKSNSTSTTKIQKEETSSNNITILGNVKPGSRIVSGNNNIIN